MILGQDKLINLLLAYGSAVNFPKTVLLVGAKGCGKHSVISLIADKFKVNTLDISELISSDCIDYIYTNTSPMFYIIDASKITERHQNICLKILEEPPQNSHIVILAETKEAVLNTVYNRCVVYTFEPYNKDTLRLVAIENVNLANVSDEELNIMLDYCETPGDVKLLTHNTYTNMLSDVELLVAKISVMLFSNIFKLSNKINFTDEYDKYDCKVFLRMLLQCIYKKIISENTNLDVLQEFYNLVDVTISKLVDSRLNKEMLVENMLTKMWKVSRGI